MAWRKPTVQDLTATLSQVEVEMYQQSPDYDTGEKPEERILADTAELVRGYLRKLSNHGHLRIHPEDGYVPSGMMNALTDIAAFKLLKRFSIDVSDPRKKAYDEAMQILRDVADEKMMPEDYVDPDATEEESINAAASVIPVYCMDFNPHTLCEHGMERMTER